MKSLLIFTLFIITKVSAQQWDVMHFVHSNSNQIQLRWMPPTQSTWQAGITNGYTITKKRYSSTGVFEANESNITIAPVVASDTTLSKWTPYWKADSLVYKGLMYITINQKLSQSSVSNRDPATVNASTTDSERYFFANVYADSKFKVAELCGLGYTDNSVLNTKKYEYIIAINGLANVSTSTGIITVTPTILPDIPINFVYENKKMKIGFGSASLDDSYSGYYIEKSTNAGASYSRLNAKPYINLSDSTAKNYYNDSIPNNTANYKYRVVGISYFDYLKYSSTKDTTFNKKLYLNSGIKSVDNVGANFKVSWQYPFTNIGGLAFNKSTDIGSYKIAVSKNDNAKLTQSADYKVVRSNINKLDTTILIPKVEILTALGDTLRPYYYFVITKGIGGDSLMSPAAIYLPMVMDKIPPSTPSGGQVISPVSITNNRIVIQSHWNQSTDNNGQVIGYKVFRSIGTDLEKVEISGGYIKKIDAITNKAIAYDTLGANLDFKDIKYHVFAVDSNYNQSPMHTFMYVMPDKRRPLPSSFLSVFVNTTNAVELNVSFSPSKKLEPIDHLIYRKEQGTTQAWVNIFTIPHASSQTLIVDNTTEEGKTYYYSILSRDENSNFSCDSIPNFPISTSALPAYCYSIVSITRLNLSLKPAVTGLAQSYSEGAKTINLTWNYSQAGVSYFEVYRATIKPNGTFKYAFYDNTLNSTTLAYLDTKVDFDSTYKYRVRANFVDGSLSTWAEIQSAFVKESKLSANKSIVNFEKNAGSFPINVLSNINYTISSNASWLSTSVATGSNNQTLNIMATANTSPEVRRGTVTLAGSGLTFSIAVEQFAPSSGTGLTTMYFNYNTLSSIQNRPPNISRIETQIDLNANNSPVPGISDDFSCIWEGDFDVPHNGSFTFYLNVDHGANLYIDGKKVIESTNPNYYGEISSLPIVLEPGIRYPIKLEYWDESGFAGVKLQWSSNEGLSKQKIMAPNLYPKSIPPANSDDPLNNNCFVIRNPNTYKTFQVANDFIVKELPYSDKFDQRWKFIKTGNTYKIASQIDPQGKVLQVKADGNTLYDRLALGYAGNKTSENWTVANIYSNVYTIKRANSDLFIGGAWDEFPRIFLGGQDLYLEPTECPNYDAGIVLETDQINVDYKQQVKNLVIKSDIEWTISNTDSWLAFNPPYGLQNTIVAINVSKNPNQTPRESIVTIKNKNGQVNVKVLQEAAPCLAITNLSKGCLTYNGGIMFSCTINEVNNYPVGVYQFKLDNGDWYSEPWQVGYIQNGDHTYHVRKIADNTCTGSITFDSYCY